MVDVAQLVRVTDCGSEGRGFESHLPPEEQTKQKGVEFSTPFVFEYYGANLFADKVFKKKVVDLSTFCVVQFFGSAPAASGRGKTSAAKSIPSSTRRLKALH